MFSILRPAVKFSRNSKSIAKHHGNVRNIRVKLCQFRKKKKKTKNKTNNTPFSVQVIDGDHESNLTF